MRVRRLVHLAEVPAVVVAALLLMVVARLSGAQEVCRGDVDGDGRVSATDVEAVLPLLFAVPEVGSSIAERADANGDGLVSSADVTAILRLDGLDCAAPTPTVVSPTEVATGTQTPNATELPPPSPTPSAPGAPTSTTTSTVLTPSPSPMPSDTPTAHVPFCNLPGSVQTTANGIVVVPGGPPSSPDLSYLHLPVGFCAHFFGHVGNARQLRFAPGGELFVASPTTLTTGGGAGGQSAIIVLPDDDHDGTADSATAFLSGLPSTQGLMFTSGYLYYQDGTKIMRVPYATGDRVASGSSEQIADITVYHSSLHWPKPIDIADDGTIYVGNGGDQTESCDPAHPFHGGILKLDGSAGGSQVAKGFRNPISLRCVRGHTLCYAIELARDFTAAQGGREKVVPIQQDDDWGFPCCATKDLPFPDIRPKPDCSTVASESAAFIIGETPFDLDFETGKWPAPWNHRAYVPLHGEAGTWKGARVVAIQMDPTTGELLPGSDLPGTPSGALSEFATGWDDGTHGHGRPANVAFAADGRLFLGNDNNGDIVWIAPLGF